MPCRGLCSEAVLAYLLGQHFTIVTDHAPLQWLSAQKTDLLLCRWALALQEYDFKIVYQKGTLNTNADALSRLGTDACELTLATSHFFNSQLRQAQEEDGVISNVQNAQLQSSAVP